VYNIYINKDKRAALIIDQNKIVILKETIYFEDLNILSKQKPYYSFLAASEDDY
jgi:hypothetical protein